MQCKPRRTKQQCHTPHTLYTKPLVSHSPHQSSRLRSSPSPKRVTPLILRQSRPPDRSNIRHPLQRAPLIPQLDNPKFNHPRINTQHPLDSILRAGGAVEAHDEMVALETALSCFGDGFREQERAPVGDAPCDAPLGEDYLAGGADEPAGWEVSGR